MKKIIILIVTISLLTLSLLILYNINKDKQTNKILKLPPYYIEFNFKNSNKVVTFENILLKDIHLYKGDSNILVDRRVYPEEFTIDVINLIGDYEFKYKNIHLISENKNMTINNKHMNENKVIIDSDQNFKWNGFINYWEIPVNKVDEYNKTGKLTYQKSPGVYYTN